VSPEQLLWQTVIEKAVFDALNPEPANDQDRHEKPMAERWIRNCGRDFRFVCSLAGIDPRFLSDAFNAGRISRDTLRNSSRIGRKSE
jgi:hypothetical protein